MNKMRDTTLLELQRTRTFITACRPLPNIWTCHTSMQAPLLHHRCVCARNQRICAIHMVMV